MKGRGAYEQNRPSGRRAPRERPIHLDPRFDMELLELILRAMEWTGSAFICACKRSNQETIKNDVHMKPVSVLRINRSGEDACRLSGKLPTYVCRSNPALMPNTISTMSFSILARFNCPRARRRHSVRSDKLLARGTRLSCQVWRNASRANKAHE